MLFILIITVFSTDPLIEKKNKLFGQRRTKSNLSLQEEDLKFLYASSKSFTCEAMKMNMKNTKGEITKEHLEESFNELEKDRKQLKLKYAEVLNLLIKNNSPVLDELKRKLVGRLKAISDYLKKSNFELMIGSFMCKSFERLNALILYHRLKCKKLAKSLTQIMIVINLNEL